ncbi:MAG: hypothetical protein ACYDEV_04775 [Acidiferrobacter sp.]
MSCCYVLDLRLAPAHIAPHRYAYSVLRELNANEAVRIWSPEDPTFLMAQLQHQMRHALIWSAVTDGQGWLIHVRVRGANEPLSLVDTLRRDHETLDLRLVNTLTLLARHEWAAAVDEATRLDRTLRAHILLENELLAPLASAKAVEATAIMRREHDDIVVQLDMMTELREGAADESQELEVWLGLLAATLNKHEYREESLLFPSWERVIAKRPDQEALLAEVRMRLDAAVSR